MAAWLSINLLSLFHFLYYFLVSLAHSLSDQVPTYIFLEQLIDLTLLELLFPKKKPFLHRIRKFLWHCCKETEEVLLPLHATLKPFGTACACILSFIPARCISMWQWISRELQFCNKGQVTFPNLMVVQKQWLKGYFLSFRNRRCLCQTTAWVMSKTQKSQTWIALPLLKNSSPTSVFLAQESCYELCWSVYLSQNNSSYAVSTVYRFTPALLCLGWDTLSLTFWNACWMWISFPVSFWTSLLWPV